MDKIKSHLSLKLYSQLFRKLLNESKNVIKENNSKDMCNC